MMLKHTQSIIQQKLSERGLVSAAPLQFHSIAGGSINKAYRLTHGHHQFFCKINSATEFPQLFKKEKNGLQLIAKQNIIKTPAVIDCFETGNYQVLLLDWVTTGERNKSFWQKFGEQLAALHQVSSENFGLQEDNYMGSVPQLNTASRTWIDFLIHHRLMPLIEKCLQQNLLDFNHDEAFKKLYTKLPLVFDKEQKPSLLHGDLWNGNFICNENHEPVLIDPAVHFGHPSIDLGMTTLFGGFDDAFYEAYRYHTPHPKNHKEQWQVCNLYPLLVHLLLFGRSYLPQIEFTLQKFQ